MKIRSIEMRNINLSIRVFIILYLCIFWIVGHVDASEPRKIALLIAVSDYSKSNLQSLPGTINDIHLMAEILQGRFDFNANDITILIDAQATNSAIKRALTHLAQIAQKEDVVYIHFAGHGSQVCNLSGTEESGKDSTLVPYGARSSEEELPTSYDCEVLLSNASSVLSEIRDMKYNADDYDLLDKELNQLLTELGHKCDNVIFVSDSCHSGSITRDANAFATRGAPIDLRPHPAQGLRLNTNPNWITISACNVEEKAREFRPDLSSDKAYGLFTWTWAETLQESGPQDTWRDIHRKVAFRMGQRVYANQNPQFEGDPNRLVFAGRIEAAPKTFVVNNVWNHDVTLNAGMLLDVHPGAIFRKYDPTVPKETLPTIEIVKSYASWSKGNTTGDFKVGDFVLMESYVPAINPIKILIRADLEADQGLVKTLHTRVSQLHSYDIVDDIQSSEVVLHILRPKATTQGEVIYERRGDSLPRSFIEENPQCWILDNSESLYNGQERLKLRLEEGGVDALIDNLIKLAKARNLIALDSSRTFTDDIELKIHLYQAYPCNESGPFTDCIAPEADPENRTWKLIDIINSNDVGNVSVDQETLMLFEIVNNSQNDYYIYLVNITLDGSIIPFYPIEGQNIGAGLVKSERKRRIEDQSLIIFEPREYVRFIASKEPIDIYLLSQDGFTTRSIDENKLNPVETILAQSVGSPTRGKQGGKIGSSTWSTKIIAFDINK